MNEMDYEEVKQPKIADVIMSRLESMILEGIFKPGDRLPSERELAKQFAVSRPSLREALQKLEARGLVSIRHGGGSYVTSDLASPFTDSLLDLFQSHPEFNYDLLEFRHALEGISAYYAALNSTPADREIIRRRFEDLRTISLLMDSEREAQADAEFHLAIAEAAHNIVLLHVMRGLFGLLRKSIVCNLETLYNKRQVRDIIPEQHEKLMNAIMNADAEGARRAAQEHLAFVEETMLEMTRTQSRIERSKRRLRGLTH